MRSLLATLSCPILTLLASPNAPLRAQSGGDCPDQRSTFVPGAGQDLPPWRTCYLSVKVLGVVISVGWQSCPTGHTWVPPHQECLGAFGPGMLCEENTCVPILLEKCRCVPQGGTWLSYSACECHDAGAMGFVMEGHTVECP